MNLREPLGGRPHALREILKNRVLLMPFPAFWSGFYASAEWEPFGFDPACLKVSVFVKVSFQI